MPDLDLPEPTLDPAPSAPSLEAPTYARTRENPEFQRRFARTKIVDDLGRPLVCFHSTRADFRTFDAVVAGHNTGHASSRLGFYFAGHPDPDEAMTVGPAVAQGFVDRVDESVWPPTRCYQPGASVMPVYLDIRRPLRMSARDFSLRFCRQKEPPEPLKEMLLHGGYDGIIIERDPSLADCLGGDEYLADAYVAFHPHQIKSAIGNNGRFGPGADICT